MAPDTLYDILAVSSLLFGNICIILWIKLLRSHIKLKSDFLRTIGSIYCYYLIVVLLAFIIQYNKYNLIQFPIFRIISAFLIFISGPGVFLYGILSNLYLDTAWFEDLAPEILILKFTFMILLNIILTVLISIILNLNERNKRYLKIIKHLCFTIIWIVSIAVGLVVTALPRF
jgi:hypothetical protein